MSILKKFNLSYSAWNIYKESQLHFFFAYIERPTPTNEGKPVYGKAGNATHDGVENYVLTNKVDLKTYWDKHDVDSFTGFNGHLNIADYELMLKNGVKYINENIVMDNAIPEKKFEFELYGINIKGFIDLEVRDGDGNIYLYDWKTNSSNSAAMHKDQRLFYSWLYWKRENIIPTCHWIYLRDNTVHSDTFTEEEMVQFDNKIKFLLVEIEKKGFDVRNYDLGSYKGPFNTFFDLCYDEANKRINSDNPIVTFEIRGNFVFITGPVDPLLEDGLDFATKFDLPGKYYMQEQIKAKGRGFINLKEVGTVHLYNRNFKCFPIGLLKKFKKICREYSSYYNKKLQIKIIDRRDAGVMNQIRGTKFIDCDMKPRPYQDEAKKIFIDIQSGIIQYGTGGGKTYTGGEIIRTLDAKTLWIIDRKELLNQTKEVLEKQLGIEIGIIAGGKVDIKDVTIATIQSLHSKMYDLAQYLYSVNFVIVDEFHKSAAETYQKVFAKLPNTKYRLGLTATPKRDDGKDPILFSILGEVIFKVDSQYLIDKGYLIKPEIIFYKTPFDANKYETYAEEYTHTITSNEHRNSMIIQIIKEHLGKKILILTKQVMHAKKLKESVFNYVYEGVEHIHGNTNDDLRKEIYENFTKKELKILFLTISIGAEGLDIPDLDVIINAAANAGDVKSIQILGRVLRTFKNKKKAKYIDFVDGGRFTYKHSKARMKALKEQGHEVKIERLIYEP